MERCRLPRDRRVLPPRRSVPAKNVCTIATTSDEEIDWTTYEQQIERPVGECLKKNGLQEKVLYIVTTLGVPLKIRGAGSGMMAENSSVDSELTLLYSKLKGATVSSAPGMVPNPLFMKRDEPFQHPRFPIYLVTRLAGIRRRRREGDDRPRARLRAIAANSCSISSPRTTRRAITGCAPRPFCCRRTASSWMRPRRSSRCRRT